MNVHRNAVTKSNSNRCSTNKLTKVPIHEKIEWVPFCVFKNSRYKLWTYIGFDNISIEIGE